jgi:hypothetical protein
MGWFKKSRSSDKAQSPVHKASGSDIENRTFAEYMRKMFISMELLCTAQNLEPANDTGRDLYVLITISECAQMLGFSLDAQQLQMVFDDVWKAFNVDADAVPALMRREQEARAKNIEIGESGRQLTMKENREGVILHAAFMAGYEAAQQYESRKHEGTGPDVHSFSKENLTAFAQLFFRTKG